MADTPAREPATHVVMFWLLAGMSVAVLVPCLLVPPTEALFTLTEAEVAERARLGQLEALVAEQMRTLDALTSDAELTRRLALREMGYKPQGRVQLVGYPSHARDHSEVRLEDPLDIMPLWIQHLYPTEWAPAYRDPQKRQILWYMSTAILFFACVAYAPRGRAAAGHVPQPS